MGYFSEMSLNMQEGQKPTTEGFPVENPFEDEETFDELPVPPSDGASTPTPVEPVSASTADVDGDLQEVASGTEEQDEADSIDTQDTDGDDAGQEPETPAEPNMVVDEDKRRAEHEAAEAKRKAEWEARQGETYVLEFSGEEIAGREYQI